MKNSDIKNIIDIVEKKASAALFPRRIYCISCGCPLEPEKSVYSLCEDCLNELHWANEKNCVICGKPLEDWYPAERCAECSTVKHVFDDGMTCFQYREAEREILHHFKYNGESYIARELAEIFRDRMIYDGLTGDIIIPVPMYRPKELKRGYNQSALIAAFLSQETGIPLREDILLRIRDTVPMNRLSGKERKHNLDGAFVIPEGLEDAVRGKHVLLVDDIYTTGVTGDKCSEVLKASGAGKVTIMTAAAGRNQRELPDISGLYRKDA